MVNQLSFNGLRKLRNLSSWLVITLVVPFNKMPLFFKDLITFVISFISLFVRVIPEPVIDKIPFLIPQILRLSGARSALTFRQL